MFTRIRKQGVTLNFRLNPVSIAGHLICVLTRRDAFALALDGAAAEIDGLIATAARMGFIKFIRKNFFLLAAVGAFADNHFQVFKIIITRTMLGG